MSQVNISLMNTETSINFDGNGIQSRAEAEYRKEEERQQNEVRIFLTHPCRRQPLCIKMVYNICWRSFLRGHDTVTITF